VNGIDKDGVDYWKLAATCGPFIERGQAARAGSQALDRREFVWEKQMIQPPDILYKYRSLRNSDGTLNDYTMKLIESGEIYFASSVALNDPHEFRPRIRAWKAGTRIDKRFDLISERLMSYYKGKYDFSKYPHLSDAEKEEIKEAHVNNVMSVVDEKGFLRPSVLDRLSKLFGILALTANPAHTLMWAHYADSHKGVCIGLSTRQKPLNGARPVHYMNEIPVIELDDVPYDIAAARQIGKGRIGGTQLAGAWVGCILPKKPVMTSRMWSKPFCLCDNHREPRCPAHRPRFLDLAKNRIGNVRRAPPKGVHDWLMRTFLRI
jgi:hypothetical protein